MIPNFKTGYCHQRENLERPCSVQIREKLSRKPMKEAMEGFQYSPLLTSKTYSILSYVVGGFVGSKSQMNNNKHNLSYDLSAAVFNLLNPCKYEREKSLRKSNDYFYKTALKLGPESYCKYIVKSSQKRKMINLELEWLENCMFGLNELCYNSEQTKRDFNCDENKGSSDGKSTMENSKLMDCLDNSVDVTNTVSLCETPMKEHLSHSINYLASERFRQQSECSVESTDSESFIIFDGPDQDEEKSLEDNWKLENFDFDSEESSDDDDDDDDDDEGDGDGDDDDEGDGDDDDDDDHDDDDDDDDHDNSCCDGYDICSVNIDLAEANDKWLRNYDVVETRDDETERKVRFDDDVKVNKMFAWDFAYRAARAGPWEQMARDRFRFRERIKRLSPTISPILGKKHRDKIYKKLHS